MKIVLYFIILVILIYYIVLVAELYIILVEISNISQHVNFG